MLNFTDLAKERIQQFIERQHDQGVSALRVAGSSLEPKLWLVKASDRHDGDLVFSSGTFDVYVDPMSAQSLQGATVDFVEDVMQSGFRVFFPSPEWDDPVAQKVQEVIDQRINPNVAGHGGRITLQGVDGDAAFITLEGGCQGCGAADVTLKQGIEVMIKEAVPEIKRIIDTTDHASGENPYYQPTDQAGESPLG